MNIEDYKHRLVNDAQLCINDWQCSGDDDYLHKAAAYLKAAALPAVAKELGVEYEL